MQYEDYIENAYEHSYCTIDDEIKGRKMEHLSEDWAHPTIKKYVEGSHRRTYVFDPDDYVLCGNVILISPPLINTSLLELHSLGWKLFVYAKYLATVNHTKIQYRFTPPPKTKNNYESKSVNLSLKAFVPGNHIDSFYALLTILVKSEVDINWTVSNPAFSMKTNLKMEPSELELAMEWVKLQQNQVNELEFLQKMNDKNLERIDRKYLVADAEDPIIPPDNVIQLDDYRNIEPLDLSSLTGVVG